MNKTLKNFIVLEGLDGAGTTTQGKLLENFFKSQHCDVFFTAEPTRNKIGSFIREQILKGNITLDSRALVHLCLADRFEHLYGKDGVCDKISAGAFVISDRYFYSTIAYQSLGLDIDYIIKKCSEFPIPSILFYIDTPVDVCIERIVSRGEEREIFEKKETLEKIKKNYDYCFSPLTGSKSFFKIDGSKSIESIHSDIVDIVRKYV